MSGPFTQRNKNSLPAQVIASQTRRGEHFCMLTRLYIQRLFHTSSLRTHAWNCARKLLDASLVLSPVCSCEKVLMGLSPVAWRQVGHCMPNQCFSYHHEYDWKNFHMLNSKRTLLVYFCCQKFPALFMRVCSLAPTELESIKLFFFEIVFGVDKIVFTAK